MIARLGQFLARLAARTVPDPFVLALFLTLIVMVGGLLALTGSQVGAGIMQAEAAKAAANNAAAPSAWWLVLQGWFDGFKAIPGLAFALQMCLVLITGHALALTPAVQRLIERVSRMPRSAGGATVVVASVACLAGVVHWGLGAITGALVAREVGRHATARGLKVHYPLLGAAAYSGLAVWHGGLSGSAPLKVAAARHSFAFDLIGQVPVGQTLGSVMNLLVTGSLLVIIPLLYFLLTPRRDEDLVLPDPSLLPPPRPKPAATDLPADSLPTSAPGDSTDGRVLKVIQEGPLVGRAIGLAGLLGVGVLLAQQSIRQGSFALDLDYVNAIFLFLGLALQPSIRAYVDAVTDGAKGAAGIILQFPFYFAILGVMKAAGLITIISQAFADIATQNTFPLLAFLSAGLVNMFVPSGGGQWGVQADILLAAGYAKGVDPAVTIMAFSYGDQWTNMLQPFWALPLLGIMGLKAKDIIGYTAVIFLAMGLVVGAWLLILPAGAPVTP